MSMTNAQAALIAAASMAPGRSASTADVEHAADRFKEYLDGIDARTLRERQQAGGAWGTGAVPLP